ncbi:MAG: DJ-1/PfpI family protein [Clostridia bacterium]|nr:DJ-1/PfpI family protein [Clostridia bacterium]
MVYVMLADGFEEVEAIEPIDILKRGGVEVTTVGVKGKTVTGAHGIIVTADIEISEVNPENMELLMLPGGAGHEILDASNEVHGLINYAVVNGLYISAICASPSILGKKMMLEGKKATCFPGFEKYLYGAEVVSDKAVIDGKIITGKGAGAASEFGFAMLEILKDKETADKIKEIMQY